MNVALAGDAYRDMLKEVKLLTLKETILLAALLTLVMVGLGVRHCRQSTEAARLSSQLLSNR